ncbi:MAG: DUF2807 domain-containing protein [Pseudomonadota bacterium]
MAKKWMITGVAASIGAGAMALSAMAETLAYPADGFDEIDVSAGLSVVFERADTHSVTAEFERGGPEDVVVDVKGDTLVIKRKQSGWSWGGDKVKATFTVTAPNLTAIEASSGSSFSGSGVDAETFEIDVSSGSSVRVSGRCGAIDVDLSSGASVNAADLSCEDAVLDASSGASLSLAVSESISVDASSGASINVTGSPEVRDLDRSSGASVNIRPGAL